MRIFFLNLLEPAVITCSFLQLSMKPEETKSRASFDSNYLYSEKAILKFSNKNNEEKKRGEVRRILRTINSK